LLLAILNALKDLNPHRTARPRNLQRSPILREPKDIRQELLVVLKHAYDVHDPLPSIGVQPQPEA
jgi:hypothetical protein